MTADQPSPPAAGVAPADTARTHRCGNCEALLTGPYCAQCGQHAHASARNLQAVVHDAWHDMTHVDGRLWYTLWLLLSKPGQLTVDYFRERRARYLPPVRLYLVLSLVFFSLSLGGEPAKHRKHAPSTASATATPVPAATAPAGSEPATAAPTSPAQTGPAPAGAPAASPVVSPGPGSATPRSDPTTNASAGAAKATKANTPDDEDADDKDGDTEVTEFPATMGDVLGSGPGCDHIRVGGSAMLERALRDSCWRNSADNGASFLRALIHNAPKMMFAFLPLMAGVMSLLYWRPRRYYVEHLVFLLHNHSALYLWFVLTKLAGLLGYLWHPLSGVVAVVGIATFFYVVWYPYAAMRRYYGQGRLLTATKFTGIGLAYSICLLLTLIGGAVVTALEN